MSEFENVTHVETEYDASEIQVLEGLEAVRKRPGMYIGSTSASGLHHLVYEIVDNAIDEALAGYCTDITVTINPGNTITVTDNGRGIPVDIQKQTGRPALEVVFTVLHAGGKFGGGGYKVSGGLHGVGASVVNALSEWLTVQVHKDGKIHEMKFSRGAITQEITVIGTTDHTGTTVTFKPDGEMFDTLEYDYETLHTRMREQAFLNAGLRITITDARPGMEQTETMRYEGGIREFVTYINRNKTPLHEEVIYLAGAKDDATAEIAMQYNDGYNETLVSFANDIHTPEGGMHETGFKAALTRVLNAYGLKYGMIKDGDKVLGNRTKVKVVKNKMAPPFRSTEFDVLYGEGISRTSELVDLGVEFGILNKSGAWFSMGDTRLGQGRDAAKQYFKDHPDIADDVQKQIMEKVAEERSKLAQSHAARPSAAVPTEKAEKPADKAPRPSSSKAVSIDADDFDDLDEE